MKKFYVLGIVVLMTLLLTCCKDKNEQQTFIGNIPVNNDKSVYKNEISSIDNTKETKQTKTESAQSKESKYSKFDNTKKGWGLKRNSEHKTPGVPQNIIDNLKKYNGIYVGDTNKKVIYLTFDEGYENGYTGKILDTLKANNVKAAFFITGPYIKEHSDLVQRMINEGHIIGNHTINHPSLPEVNADKLDQEITGLDNMVYEKFKINMKYMRPPKGEYSERVLAQLKDLGHKAVLWSFAYDDYDINNQKGIDYAYKMIMDNIHNGEVMLLHAVSKDNTEVLDKVLKDIKAQGYEFRPISEL